VLAVVGDFSSTAALAASPIYQRAGIIMTTPTASHPDITKAGNYIFRDTPIASYEVKAVVDWAKELGFKKVAVIGRNDDYGRAADLTDSAACARMAAAASDRFGGIDVLCNTFGIDPPTARNAIETSDADWDRVIAVNLTAVFRTCRAVLPIMVAQRRGAIINIASQGALLTLPDMTAYGVSKAGVLQLTRQVAADYAAHGIRCNAVCPSGLETPSADRLAVLAEADLARRTAAMQRVSPLGRVCTPDDVAAAMLFLASDLSGFTTGAALPVEGGATTMLRF
jgi:NAD(P)-dependent dehydrogenase (short-subunit alcohol dehydrogenase family)